MHETITRLSIRELLRGDVQYIIPTYQRNYAWEEGEITQLIQDVIDCMPAPGEPPRRYYLGSLVVFARPGQGGVFETIDGQQRLTTLSLLASYLRHAGCAVDMSWFTRLCIDFDSRERSSATFAAIFRGQALHTLPAQLINSGLHNGYRLISKLLPLKLRENGVSMEAFAAYLFDAVQIMRVQVPPDTDLNHYFEIMNNRGEQLEKHEVLKARLMDKLQHCPRSQQCLHLVWEACASMERYVQMGFTPAQRSRLFGDRDWGSFRPADFEALMDCLLPDSTSAALPADTGADTAKALTLSELIAQAPAQASRAAAPAPDAPERFHAVINFPNFLLHVLRVTTCQDIPLDDKRLLDSFEAHVLKATDPAQAVRQFVFGLLRCRYLFDHHVIKREWLNGKDGWSLKRLKWNTGDRGYYVNTFGEEESQEGINRRMLMLQAAFHVSTPTLVYKYWLHAALHHLFHAPQVDGGRYLQYMESLATALVFDRFLAPEQGLDYDTIIHTHQGQCHTRSDCVTAESLAPRLRYGHIENNLVFNFLDYLLWLRYQHEDKVRQYEFTFRSSVEHYYPQNPINGTPLPADALNAFGNLCLISHEKNARLSNFLPSAKQEFYAGKPIDSIKQFLMMQHPGHWDTAAIAEHGAAMTQVLLQALPMPEPAAAAVHTS